LNTSTPAPASGRARRCRRELGRLRVGHAGQRVDEDLEDLLGRGVAPLLDVHAAFARGHHRDLLRRAVGDGGDVVLLLDVGAFSISRRRTFWPSGPVWWVFELHAEDLARELLHVVERARELDAAALAAPAGVDLRLHDPDRAAELSAPLRWPRAR
jgi:hypothetical protein